MLEGRGTAGLHGGQYARRDGALTATPRVRPYASRGALLSLAHGFSLLVFLSIFVEEVRVSCVPFNDIRTLLIFLCPYF